MRNAKILIIPLFLIGICGHASAADQCPPLTSISSVDMRLGSDGRAYVPVKINGTQKSMIVDTGGSFSEVKQSVVDELKLDTHHSRMELVGVSGDTTDVVARAAFTLGNLHSDSMDLMVAPSEVNFAPDISDAAGILAPNLLSSYDVDFDFGGKKFNLISQKHCDGKVVYWPADAVAVIPFNINSDGHILVPVELDGHRLIALLDTGASNSVLNLETATDDYGLKPGTAGMASTGHLPGMARSLTYEHRFRTLSLEGLNISNPDFDLIPDLMRNKLPNPNDSLVGDTRIPDKSVETGLGDIILGMNVLHRLHLYIAYKEKKLYITPASGPANSTPAADATAAQSASH